MGLAELPAGFADPVQHAQAVFRCLLDAMARPGTIGVLPDEVSGSITPPEGCSRAASAVLLTLADADVRLHLDPAGAPALAGWLRFHTGVHIVSGAEQADWLLFRAEALADPPVILWRVGDDEAPHTAPTLLIDVPSLDPAPAAGSIGLRLSGPGIEAQQALAVGGLDASFWRQRIALQAQFPCGVDMVLCCGDRLAALPRSTRVQMTGA
jgi:alpha-D-ribose 1-methylphosphonate 5-triphosphate synthase subunit PhnH